jgi:hypothetical protein
VLIGFSHRKTATSAACGWLVATAQQEYDEQNRDRNAEQPQNYVADFAGTFSELAHDISLLWSAKTKKVDIVI